MYSVVLTELGVSVFKGEELEKAFAFSDPVKEYIAIKERGARLGDLVGYLGSVQRGVKVSDEALLSILQKNSIDATLMEEAHLEAVQATKPEIMVQSGFASNPQDALGKLRKFALGVSSSRVTEASESPDMHIVQAISSLDEVDKVANLLSSRLREWYGLHFPELENMIDSINGYAQLVIAGRRGSLTKDTFKDAGFPDPKVEMLALISSQSRGGEISDENLHIAQSIARQILEFFELRRGLEAHVESEMRRIAPNLTAILGAPVGARIMARAGSLKRLASFPASTIQVLGAERALFRSLKTGSQPPKHGLLFQHPLVHAAPRWQRGKIARAIATKAAIAARIDIYGEGLNKTLLEKLNVRIVEIGDKHAEPPEPRPQGRDGRGRGDAGRGYQGRRGQGRDRGREHNREHGREHDGRKRGKKTKKRKRFAKR